MMKILELFSGYGTATFALKRLGIPHEIIGYSDIDKYANQCFQQNHGGKQLGDVKLINPNDLEDFDLLTGGFPCQAFSVAGKMGGELDPRGTLFYEIIRIAEVKKPKFMLLENVKGLTSKKFTETFNKILSELNRIGYNIHWKVLNSKDFGIPQSRARVWFVCFRDKSDWLDFKWPEPVELKIFIKDILEPSVDQKYYLSEKLQERFRNYLIEKNNKIGKENPAILDLYNKKVKTDGTSITLTEPHHNNLRLIEGTIVNLQPRMGKGIGGKGIISKNDGTAYCVDKCCGQGIVAMRQRDRHGKNEPKEQQLEPREDGCSNTITSVQKDNLVYESHRANEIREYEETSPTLKSTMGTGGNNVPMVMNTITQAVGRIGHSSEEMHYIENNMNAGQLRRLSPTECFRLMGFLNDEINLEGLSDTQRYKLAGNGQDVNMVTKIFERMFK